LNVNTMKRMRWFVVVLLLAFAVIAGEGIASYYTGWQHDTFVMDQQREVADGEEPQIISRVRHLGFLNDPNDLAQALVTMLPLLALEWRGKRRLESYAVVVPLAATFFWGIVLTRSRGGLVAMAITTLLALRERVGRVAATVLTTMLVAGFLAF